MSSTPVEPADELTRPLGRESVVATAHRPGAIARPLAGLLGVVLAGAAGYAAWFGEPFGGIPIARVPITEAPVAVMAAPLTAPMTASAVPADAGRRDETLRDARRLETESGVAVTRPSGTSAPKSVIMTIPDGPAHLASAPDERIVERTRFGLLPKLGPDGLRAADVYARPMGKLPNGVRPIGLVAVLVGGLGISQSGTADAIAKLPPDVTLAFAPYGAGLEAATASARDSGHEIMLQVPMEPFDYPDSDPGPHTLTVAGKTVDNLDHLRWAMGRFVGYTGIVNYMGAKLTADASALGIVLRDIEGRGLTMLDDGTSSRSRVTALAAQGRAARADAVVDGVMRGDAIDKALQSLEATARLKGVAIGSATAFPLTVQRLSQWAETLASRGILLVPVSAAISRAPADKTVGP